VPVVGNFDAKEYPTLGLSITLSYAFCVGVKVAVPLFVHPPPPQAAKMQVLNIKGRNRMFVSS
jgi:hypothetical protein